MVLKTFLTILTLIAAHSRIWAAGAYVEQYSDFSADRLPGRLYEPPNAATNAEKRPLILALHGGGAIGSNNIGNVWDFDELFVHAQAREAFIYAPQATSAFWFVGDRHQKIMTMIDNLIEDKNIDTDRIYVTGFSMGGGGTWDLLKLYPDRFAAAIPICGIAPRVSSDHTDIVGKPIWAFHARNDPSVSNQTSRTVINRILDANERSHPNYTNSGTYNLNEDDLQLSYREYATGGHAIWPTVYSDENIINWLFSQNLKESKCSLKIIEAHLTENAKMTLTIRIPETFLTIEQSQNLQNWTPLTSFTRADDTINVIASTPKAYYRIKQRAQGDN